MFSAIDGQFQNALNALIHNESLQKMVLETLEFIDKRMSLLSDTLEYVESFTKAEDDRGGGFVSDIIRGESLCRVRKPFFSSNNSLIPFNNEVVERRIIDGSYDFYQLKSQIQNICSEKQFELLKIAIGKNMYDIEHAELIRSKDKRSAKKLKALKMTNIAELSSKCYGSMVDRIDWMTISSKDLQGKISHQDCKRLWEKVFNPEYVYKSWTEVEIDTLMRLTSEYGCHGNWVQISEKMPVKRQPFVCFKKWLELTSKMETSEEWKPEEDEQLNEVVSKVKERKMPNENINWNKVAYLIPNRSAKDCERRWNSFQLQICNRPFSDENDYQLLILIKKMGSENWFNIAREMDQRTVEQCQQRYCDIVEELQPWTYFEDRRLWLVLKSYFRTIWTENNQAVDATMSLNIYKSVMKGFNGRCALLLRHRYLKLCKWFYLWNQFYLSLGTKELKNSKISSEKPSLLSESSQEKSIVISKILKIILRTTFFDRIRHAFYLVGSRNPASDANKLITECKNGNSSLLNKLIKELSDPKLVNLIMFIIDLQNGIFIPTKFEDYIHRKFVGFKYPKRASNDLRILSSTVRTFESKVAVSTTLRKHLVELLNDSTVSDEDRSCIQKMVDCEGTFVEAFNFAETTLDKSSNFNFSFKVHVLEEFLPEILKLMINYIYCQKHRQLTVKDIKIRRRNINVSECEQIAELLMYREIIPSVYKTYMGLTKKNRLVTMLLPKTICTDLTNHDKLRLCKKNVRKILAMQQRFPVVDNAVSSSSEHSEMMKDIPVLQPNICSLNFIRALILQKQALLTTGRDAFSEMVQLRYDNPVNYLQDGSLFNVAPMKIDKSSLLLADPNFILLRSRILSVLAIPSIVARIPSLSCAFKGDKLHEQQNGVFGSTKLSECFSVSNLSNLAEDLCNKHLRKRKFLESPVIDAALSQKSIYTSILKVEQNQPLTRRISQRWATIYAPESKRTFFVSRNIRQSFIKSDFMVQSINGVNIKDFLS